MLGQAFGKNHRLVMAGRVGQADDAHLAAGAGAPLLPRHHRAGDAAGGRAGLHRTREIGPGLHAQFLEHGGVIVERMAGEKEADRLVFAFQALGRQPRLGIGQRRSARADRRRRTIRSGRRSRTRARAGRARAPRPSAGKTRARFGSNSSKAPAAARLSSTRLLTARGLMRSAKSARSANKPASRAATIASTACGPTPLSAASA